MRDDILLAFLTSGLALAGWNLLATWKNTIALTELTIHLKEHSKKLELVDKHDKDIQALKISKNHIKFEKVGELL